MYSTLIGTKSTVHKFDWTIKRVLGIGRTKNVSGNVTGQKNPGTQNILNAFFAPIAYNVVSTYALLYFPIYKNEDSIKNLHSFL